MIIDDNNVLIDIVLDNERFSNLNFFEVEKLLLKYKEHYNNLMPKEMTSIPNCFAYFSNDINNNEFICKIYKTSFDTDRWIMLMKDDYEGYALYKNPSNNKYEIAWYHSELEEPLDANEEEKIRTCYNPITKS